MWLVWATASQCLAYDSLAEQGAHIVHDDVMKLFNICMEIIYALHRPTVAEFAAIDNLSSSNAAYKVNNLVKKGYLKKVQSTEDKREYHLEVTEKYMNYYNISYSYIDVVMQRVAKRFTPEEILLLKRFLEVTAEELMPELAGVPRHK